MGKLSHLDELEAEAIYIIREVAAECEKPVMLYSIGKDSSVMLHLALKAFYPEKPPFPFLHVNTTWKFKEMIEFRDKTAKKYGLDMIEYINEEGVKKGIRTIVATPPYNKKNPIMDGDKLDRIVEQLNIEAGRIDPYYKVYLGREIEYNDENHQKIISGQLDSMADSKYVMIRFQYDIDFETISEAIRDINMDGYIPIVADVEQYECLESDEDKVEELIQLGAYVQISAAAVVGGLGHDIKSFSRKLLKEELVHFVASDALDSEDKAPYLRECAEYIERKYGEDYMNELFYTNPKAVIENDDIDI